MVYVVFLSAFVIGGFILLFFKKYRIFGKLILDLLPSIALFTYIYRYFDSRFTSLWRSLENNIEYIPVVAVFFFSVILLIGSLFMLSSKVNGVLNRVLSNTALITGYISTLMIFILLLSEKPGEAYWFILLIAISGSYIGRVIFMLFGEKRRIGEFLLATPMILYMWGLCISITFNSGLYPGLYFYELWYKMPWEIIAIVASSCIAALALAGMTLRLFKKSRRIGNIFVGITLSAIESIAVAQMLAYFIKMRSSVLGDTNQIVFLSILSILTAVGVILIFIKKTRSKGKLILYIELSVVSLFVIYKIAKIIFDKFPNQIWTLYIAVIGMLIVLVILSCIIWKRKIRKLIYIPMLSIAALCFLQIFVASAYDSYSKSLPVIYDEDYLVHTEFDIKLENSKIASLLDEATLKIDKDFPKIQGQAGIYPLYAAFVKAVYSIDNLKDNSVLNICSQYSYIDLLKNNADMIFTTLQPTAEDIQRSEKYKTEFIITPIARTPVVFFVNSDNPINNISEKEIQEIYSGEISRWSQLGGKSIRHIKAYQSYYDDICQMELKILMGDIPLIEPIQIRKLCVCGYYHMNIADYTNYKNAIGFSLRLYTTEMVDNNEIKLLSVNGVYPSNENVINNTYPLCVTIYAVITQDSNPKCNDILDWIQSEQGQCLIKKSGFVGIGDKVN